MSLEHSLFRREALEFQQQDRQWGKIMLLEPASTKIMAWALVLAIALMVAFLSFAQYARKENVFGYLTPTAGTAKIFAPQTGTVSNVHVREGDQIREGQPLLTIETAQISADGKDVNVSILESLSQQREALIRQVAAEEERTTSEKQRLALLIGGLENELTHLGEQVKIQTERARLSETLTASAATLSSKGIMSDLENKRRQQELLEQRLNLNSLKQQVAARRNQLTETTYALEQLPTVMAEKIRQLQSDLLWADQRIAEINSRRAYVIRAPTAGRVSMLQASVGQKADPRHLQLEIVPSDGVLQAELFIPTRAAGFVEIGQEVRILYDAFPYQKFGTSRGRITKMSQTIVTASDIAGPISIKEPVYKATAVLERAYVNAEGKQFPLQADMLLTANIILERRSVMSWLIDPLFGAGKVLELPAGQGRAAEVPHEQKGAGRG